MDQRPETKHLVIYLSPAMRFPTTRNTINAMPNSTKWVGVKFVATDATDAQNLRIERCRTFESVTCRLFVQR